jgi:hypothetical protein
MKILLVSFFSLIALTSCTKEIPNSLIPEPVTSKATPILEITSEYNGMFSIIGKSLFIRLYDDRNIEFDYFDPQKIKPGINKTEDVKVLKKMTISEQEFQQLVNLLNSEDFQQISGEFKRKCCCTDASINFEIVFKTVIEDKKIGVYGFCDLNEITSTQSRYRENLPKIISELMTLTVNTKLKYIPD